MYGGYHPDHFWDPNDFRGLPPVVGNPSSNNGTAGGNVQSKSKTADSTGSKSMSVKELQNLVEKQAEELERLSERLGATSSLPDLSQCMK